MEFQDKEPVELTLSEIAGVTGAGEPVNNPPGVVAMDVVQDGMPDNNPPG